MQGRELRHFLQVSTSCSQMILRVVRKWNEMEVFRTTGGPSPQALSGSSLQNVGHGSRRPFTGE